MKQMKSGISLVVLVITIIVAIILTSSVIMTLTGLDLMDNANKAVDLNNMKELRDMVSSELILNGWYEGKTVTADKFEEYLKDIDDVEINKIAPDAWTVSKNGAYVTVYSSGDMYNGKVDVWDGSSMAVPELKDGNWYIYNCAELNFLQAVVNGTLTDAQKAQVTNAGYNLDDYTLTSTTTVYLMENLDLGARQTNGELTTGAPWTPIGNNSTRFAGNIEGNYHTIRGVYIKTTDNFVGIIGFSTGVVSNLTIAESYIEGKQYVGGIAGVDLGNVTNCHNINTNVFGTNGTVGGIVGQVQGIISNCSNNGQITSSGLYGGGITGYATQMVQNCTNNGNIINEATTVEDQALGGIVGRGSGTSSIYNCINNGNVIGTREMIGGIAGYFGGSSASPGAAKMSGCINVGDVSGEIGVGGLIGVQQGGTVEKSYNVGVIYGKGDCGGIIGTSQATVTIQNCFNVGNLIFETSSTNNGVGGIVGFSSSSATGKMSNNYNLGKITLKENNNNIGGIIGYMANSNLAFSNNYYMEGIMEVTGNGKGTAITSANMKTQAFVDMLNAGLTTPVWEIRIGENNGYPVIIK